MAAFRLTPSAEDHVGFIVEFIATDNEDAAVRVRHALYSAFDLLASRPDIGHAREDLTNRPLKFWSVYSYLVVYDPKGSRHPPYLAGAASPVHPDRATITRLERL